MIKTTNDYVIMAVDNTTELPKNATGRNSLRIESKKLYNSGLFLISLRFGYISITNVHLQTHNLMSTYISDSHMPQGCGTHPAFWTEGQGQSWPNGGEIDIIEEVNDYNYNHATLHTSADCDYAKVPRNYTGYTESTNCTVSGCGIQNRHDDSFGPNFNKDKGGLYLTQWTTDGIYMWFWSGKDKWPQDIFTKPNTCDYGIPYAAWPFGEWCSFNHFINHTIIFDIGLCGDWAGGSNWDGHCKTDTGYSSCDDYVRDNPHKFSDAYFQVEQLLVFQR